MKDPMEYKPRLMKTVVRHQVVQVFALPQSDEPPGRKPFRNEEVVIFAHEQEIDALDTQGHIQAIATKII